MKPQNKKWFNDSATARNEKWKKQAANLLRNLVGGWWNSIRSSAPKTCLSFSGPRHLLMSGTENARPTSVPPRFPALLLFFCIFFWLHYSSYSQINTLQSQWIRICAFEPIFVKLILPPKGLEDFFHNSLAMCFQISENRTEICVFPITSGRSKWIPFSSLRLIARVLTIKITIAITITITLDP